MKYELDLIKVKNGRSVSKIKSKWIFTFSVRGRKYGANDIHSLIALFNQVRDESCEGASTFPNSVIYKNDKVVGRFSYNGRVWPNKEWTPDLKPLALENL